MRLKEHFWHINNNEVSKYSIVKHSLDSVHILKFYKARIMFNFRIISDLEFYYLLNLAESSG